MEKKRKEVKTPKEYLKPDRDKNSERREHTKMNLKDTGWPGKNFKSKAQGKHKKNI